MELNLIKTTFSHASCKQALENALMAIVNKTYNSSPGNCQLSIQELNLLNQVQATFGNNPNASTANSNEEKGK